MDNSRLMVRTLFTAATSNVIDEVCMYIGEYGKVFGVNTNLRLAHFLAQVREEVGPEFKPVTENLNYSVVDLPRVFKSISNADAIKYGRTSSQKANQEMIANIVYADRLGNGNVASGDGCRFRGTGSLQITGKYNFAEVQKRLDKYAPNCGVNLITGYNEHTLKGAILIGLGFWIWKDLYRLADNGSDEATVNSITTVINKYTESYKNRANYFKAIKHLI